MDPQTEVVSDESPLIAKLRAARARRQGEKSFTLEGSGVTVSYPEFRSFAEWEQAQRQAGDMLTSVNLYYIVQICKFDGERLRAEQYRELISDADHMTISAKIFGGGGGREGNA